MPHWKKPIARRSLVLQWYPTGGRRFITPSAFHKVRLASSFELEKFAHASQPGGKADKLSFVAALKECSRSRDVERGKRLHSQVQENGLSNNIYVESTLVDMYSRCGCMVLARDVFDNMVERNVVPWNSLIRGYVDNGDSETAIKLFDGMQEAEGGCAPNARTYVAALTACASLGGRKDLDCRKWLEKGQAIHSRAVSTGCCDLFVESALMDMYAKCSRMVQAQEVFDRMVRRDVVAWNTLLQGYVENGESKVALELFQRMQNEEAEEAQGGGCYPDTRTFITALMACCAVLLAGEQENVLPKTKAIHSRAVRSGCCDMIVESLLVSTYSGCFRMLHARSVFDNMACRDAVTWNALLQGYVENGDCELALELFDDMEDACAPNDRSYVAALTAYANLVSRKDLLDGNREQQVKAREWIEKAKAMHSAAVRRQCCELFVESTLVNVYAKCRSMDLARAVFDNMTQPDVIAWNCLIQGYVENGKNELALQLIAHMDVDGVGNTYSTFIAALAACSNLMDLDKGRVFHEEIRSCGLEQEAVLRHCLVDFYGKCGSMEDAKQVFDGIREKGILAWSTLMSGYSLQGDIQGVFQVFDIMREQGTPPNEFIFTHLLSSCSHAGLVDKGKSYFDAMQAQYGVKPNKIHYSCIVDLLARANRLEEAVKMVKNMPSENSVVAWTAILAACHKWNNVIVGRTAYEALIKLDQKEAATYVLMANILGAGDADKLNQSRGEAEEHQKGNLQT